MRNCPDITLLIKKVEKIRISLKFVFKLKRIEKRIKEKIEEKKMKKVWLMPKKTDQHFQGGFPNYHLSFDDLMHFG